MQYGSIGVWKYMQKLVTIFALFFIPIKAINLVLHKHEDYI